MLIYLPLTKGLFEIKFVEHENIFYQLNQIYTYRLDVEKFVYSSEVFNTGVSAVDAIEDARSTDMFNYEVRLEDNSGAILLENGFKLIKEDYKLVDTTTTATTSQSIAPLAQNREFGLNADSIVDFSVSNPFGDISQNK